MIFASVQCTAVYIGCGMLHVTDLHRFSWTLFPDRESNLVNAFTYEYRSEITYVLDSNPC